MKTLIIARPRTRSNLLIHAHSEFHNLVDKHEIYTLGTGKIIESNTKNINFKHSLFESQVKKITEENFKQDNFVIKLFPRMVILGNHHIENLDSYEHRIIDNLSYFYNIQKYDKIYFLNRNIIDSVCSYMFGLHVQSFISTDTSLYDYNESVIIDIDDRLNFYLYEYAIQSRIKDFIERKNLSCTILDYQDIPQYVGFTYPNIKNKTIDSKIDYKKIITNYNEVCDYISQTYKTYLDKANNINFY